MAVPICLPFWRETQMSKVPLLRNPRTISPLQQLSGCFLPGLPEQIRDFCLSQSGCCPHQGHKTEFLNRGKIFVLIVTLFKNGYFWKMTSDFESIFTVWGEWFHEHFHDLWVNFGFLKLSTPNIVVWQIWSLWMDPDQSNLTSRNQVFLDSKWNSCFSSSRQA